jgi:hypothetical protein
MESFSLINPLFFNLFGGDFSFYISFHYPCRRKNLLHMDAGSAHRQNMAKHLLAK